MPVASDPSRPSLPARPVTPRARRRDRRRVDPEDLLWRDAVSARLRWLTAALTAAIAVACVALGVAVWGLLADDGGRDGGGGRLEALEQRVAQLEAASRRAPTPEALTAVRQEQQVLVQRLAALSDGAAQLDQRLRALEQAAPAP